MAVTGSFGTDVMAWLQSFDEQPGTEAEVLEVCAAHALSRMHCAQYADVVQLHDGMAVTVASTAGNPALLDEIRQRHRPGLAAGQQGFVRVDDVACEPRYRRELAGRTPIQSVLAFPLAPGGAVTAELSFYAEQPHAFDDAAVELGSLLAIHTSLVWQMLRRHEQFHAALASRDVIGQAKGMVMERFGIDAAQAFGLLKRLSQESNRPLTEVARQLVSREMLRR